MGLKKLFLICITICLTQIINSVFTEHFLLGICQFMKTQIEEDQNDSVIMRTRLDSLKLISNLSIYGRPLLKVIFGALLTIYFGSILATFWCLRFQKKLGNFGKYVQTTKAYYYLFGSIIVNVIILAILIYMDLKQRRVDEDLVQRYDQFKYDFGMIVKEPHSKAGMSPRDMLLLSDNSLLNVRHSVAKLKTIIRIGNINAFITFFFIALGSVLTFWFLFFDCLC